MVGVGKRISTAQEVTPPTSEKTLTAVENKARTSFSMNSFNRILKNEKYIGEFQYQDIVIPGDVPAVVSENLFYRVQERLEKNKRAPAMAKADADHLLTTKLFCGMCERMMVGESGTSHTGDKHYYYKCAGAKRTKDCKKKSVKKEWIEKAVVVPTVNRVLKDDEISRIADSIIALQESEYTTTPALKNNLPIRSAASKICLMPFSRVSLHLPLKSV